MTAVQWSEETAVIVAVSPTPPEGAAVVVRRRRLRRVRGLDEVSRHRREPGASHLVEAEDHWDDGARAQLAMAGITYRAY